MTVMMSKSVELEDKIIDLQVVNSVREQSFLSLRI